MLPRPEEDTRPFIQLDVAYTGEQATLMCSYSLYNKLPLCFSGILESQNIVQRSLFLSLHFLYITPSALFSLSPTSLLHKEAIEEERGVRVCVQDCKEIDCQKQTKKEQNFLIGFQFTGLAKSLNSSLFFGSLLPCLC